MKNDKIICKGFITFDSKKEKLKSYLLNVKACGKVRVGTSCYPSFQRPNKEVMGFN